MYDTKSVAFEIKYPFKDKHGHRSPILTVWHNDPETDGTDDSCGWNIRLRHADKNVYEKIVKEFECEWDNIFKSDDDERIYNCGWFTPAGFPVLSVQAIVFNMYLYASKIVFNPNGKISPTRAWNKAWRFMDKYHTQIVYFAENNRDSMSDRITRKFENACNQEYTPENRMAMIRTCAEIIYTDILRRERKWWQHPRWHIHHWSFQFHPTQQLKRRYWDECCKCGKRGFKGAAMSDWNGTKLWHEECDDSQKPIPEELDIRAYIKEADTEPIFNAVKSNYYKELVDEATSWYASLSDEQLQIIDCKELGKFHSSSEHNRILIDLYMKHSRQNNFKDEKK